MIVGQIPAYVQICLSRHSRAKTLMVCTPCQFVETTLFLGAGASVFAGMPTTKDLVDMVFDRALDHEQWESQEAGRLAVGIVEAHKGKDVEEMYRAIHDMLAAERQHQTVVKYKARDDIHVNQRRGEARTVVPVALGSKPAKDEAAGIRENIRALESLETVIRNTLLDSLMVRPEYWEAITSTYKKLLESVSRRIVTTNYDNVLEICCEQLGVNLVNGFKKTHLGYRRMWSGEWGGEENALHLVKLHGSITWQKDDNDAVQEIGSPGRRDTDRDVMIAPTLGEKDYTDDIFPALMSRFKKMLDETSLLVVVGFSFRDPEINRIFQDRLIRTDKNPRPMKLLHVDPEPDGLKELVGPYVETRGVQGGTGLLHFTSDRMPYVYAYKGRFDQSVAESIGSLLSSVRVAHD